MAENVNEQKNNSKEDIDEIGDNNSLENEKNEILEIDNYDIDIFEQNDEVLKNGTDPARYNEQEGEASTCSC